jgi:hypothetical protein
MTKFAVIAALILVLFGDCTALARSGSGTNSSGRTTHVQGYIRKDGTHVKSYERHESGTASHAAARASVSAARQAHIYRAHVASGFVGARDVHGRIIRSETAKREFMQMTGYPHGRPGYVIDHIIALKRGGPDKPSNMQWQTIEEAKAKDRWE